MCSRAADGCCSSARSTIVSVRSCLALLLRSCLALLLPQRLAPLLRCCRWQRLSRRRHRRSRSSVGATSSSPAWRRTLTAICASAPLAVDAATQPRRVSRCATLEQQRQQHDAGASWQSAWRMNDAFLLAAGYAESLFHATSVCAAPALTSTIVQLPTIACSCTAGRRLHSESSDLLLVVGGAPTPRRPSRPCSLLPAVKSWWPLPPSPRSEAPPAITTTVCSAPHATRSAACAGRTRTICGALLSTVSPSPSSPCAFEPHA